MKSGLMKQKEEEEAGEIDLTPMLDVVFILLIFFIVTSVSAQTGNPNQHGEQDAPHCRAMGMADGSPHVDPPQNVLDQVQAEYKANCQAGNCFLGEGNYQLLEGMGHTREKIDCFLKAGEDQHNQQHGGDPNQGISAAQ